MHCTNTVSIDSSSDTSDKDSPGTDQTLLSDQNELGVADFLFQCDLGDDERTGNEGLSSGYGTV